MTKYYNIRTNQSICPKLQAHSLAKLQTHFKKRLGQYNKKFQDNILILRKMKSNWIVTTPFTCLAPQKRETLETQVGQDDLTKCPPQKYKHLSSSKKLPKVKLHSFGSGRHKRPEPRRRSVRVARLVSEKQELLESIDVLRASAISAIAEKQDQIHKLSDNNLFDSEECASFYRQQLQRCLLFQQELQRSNNELADELQHQKEYFSEQLAERQDRVKQLLEVIVKMRNYITELEESQRQYKTQLNRLERHIQQLNAEIGEYILKLELAETNHQPNHEYTHEDRQSNDLCCVKHRISEDKTSNLSAQQELNLALTKRQNLKREELELKHEAEISRLIDFYEAKLQNSSDLRFRNFEPASPELQKRALIDSKQHEQQVKGEESIFQEPAYLDLTSEPSVHNLRQQISPFTEQRDYGNWIELTKEHSVPSLFHKHKSSVYWERQQKSVRIVQTKCTQNHIEKSQKQCQRQLQNKVDVFWEKLQLFSTGFISGASVGSLLSILLRSK